MKKIIITILIILITLLYTTTALADSQLLNNKEPIFINQNLTPGTKRLDYTEFTLMHSSITKSPLWVAEYLTKDRILTARTLTRENNFHSDPNLDPNDRAELEDYKQSGYDRGHMAPNSDMSNINSQYECFTLANIIPQNPDNNRNLWEGIESSIRNLAIQENGIYIITGPIYLSNELQQLNGRVAIPTHIFKAIYDPKTNQAAAYLVENKEGMEYKVISITELEQKTGINLFPDLSEDIKNNPMELPIPKPYNQYSNNNSSNNSHNSYNTISLNKIIKTGIKIYETLR